MADVHENKTNKEEVRLMTYEDEANYDDVTIEEVLEEEQPQGNARAGQKQSTRPESFDRVYEDNSNRQQKQGYQGYSQGYRTYGSGPRIFSVNLGRGTSLGKSWKYRIIGGLVIFVKELYDVKTTSVHIKMDVPLLKIRCDRFPHFHFRV